MEHGRRISVIGLGYVGLPVAVAFGRRGVPVTAFDIDARRVNELSAGVDSTGEVPADELAEAKLSFTTDPKGLKSADFHIVTVPTPITDTKRPALDALVSACRSVGSALKVGDIVVFESTVYPGATEETCVPELEKASGLKFGKDFTVGYSPERINPGDKQHRFETIKKVVSGSDAKTLDIVAAVYGSVVKAGLHRAPSIQAAEAAKVIENTQRDINIALMNELSVIFHRLGLDMQDVLAAAGTKWNFLPFTPGLVGGHCIGVDPYYLTHRAEQVGYHPEVILSGRRINDAMGPFVATAVIEALMKAGVARPTVVVLGVTFKENVPDFRNTRVVDIIAELERFGVRVAVHDPLADPGRVEKEYGLVLTKLDDLPPADAVILATAHDTYRQGGWTLVSGLLKGGAGFVADVRAVLNRESKPDGIDLWRL
ncbi:MAG: GDP-mannose dehydrogenase [Alphaproteobacteria bacterium RIFOXYD12_FULL_60_8]|nr:MAG: GDP-mannose dehydrogenase [Alphaproteobacteria bacterium RIFOXYD12_FULL_60_8]